MIMLGTETKKQEEKINIAESLQNILQKLLKYERPSAKGAAGILFFQLSVYMVI